MSTSTPHTTPPKHQRSPASPRGKGPTPMISVIVPVRNEAPFIGQTLEQLVAQDYPADRLEILVVDGMSDDSTPRIIHEIARRAPQVHLLTNPRRWSSAARNVGIRASRGDIILIVDGHCQFPTEQYLRHVALAFARTGVDCLGRPQPLEVEGASLLQRAIAAARRSWLGHHPDSFVYSNREQIVPARSVGVAYRREVFEQIGFFDESFDACEDVEFNHRLDQAGLRCVLAPSVALKYYPRDNLGGLFSQMRRYGRGRSRLLRKHPDTLSLKTFLPALFLVWLAAALAGSLMHPALRWINGGVLAVYAAVVAAASVQIAWQNRQPALLVYLPAVFFTIHAGAGVGLLEELFSMAFDKLSPLRWKGRRLRKRPAPSGGSRG